MIRPALLLLLLPSAVLAVLAAPPVLRTCDPVRIIDGDTIVCTVAGVRETVRVAGVDTPEMRARCPTERALADAATRETTALVFGSARVDLLGRPDARDRYGRLLARVKLVAPGSASGEDLAGILIANGLGVPYAGAKRRDWCAP